MCRSAVNDGSCSPWVMCSCSVVRGNQIRDTYENFMSKWQFPIKYKEYNSVMKAIPTGLLMLMRCHVLSYNICRPEPVLCLNGVDINSKKFTNTFIRQIFYKIRSIKPRGNFFWNVFFTDIKWDKAWSLPYRTHCTNTSAITGHHTMHIHDIAYA